MILIVLRGIPGIGKTTLANKIAENYQDSIIISNDLIRKKSGVYNYDLQENKKIYRESNKLLLHSFINKKECIIVDNCNISINVLNRYKLLAKKYKYYYLQLAFEKPNIEDINDIFARNKNNISYDKFLILYNKYKIYNQDTLVENLKDYTI